MPKIPPLRSLLISFTSCVLPLSLCGLAMAAPPQGVYENREQDWRNGAVVYQVIVDRFAPSANLAAKRALYPAPKLLRDWS